jgi:hypothetical protein
MDLFTVAGVNPVLSHNLPEEVIGYRIKASWTFSTENEALPRDLIFSLSLRERASIRSAISIAWLAESKGSEFDN